MSSKSDLAVSVRGLSKSYTIAHEAERHVTLAETLLARTQRPFARAPRETFWALREVEFDIRKGDVVGIIGRNGAGKSTLLKILSRITEPTTGHVDLYGRVGSLLEVGTGFHPELTGRENVFLNGAILGMTKPEIRKQFDAIVDFAGVEQFLDTPVKRYSSGMYVRLAFAVAAHLQLEILVVDEVLAVGDAEFQKKCIGKMRDAGSSGRTVIFVSHNIGALLSLCEKGLLLSSGRSSTIVSIGECVARYSKTSVTEQGRSTIHDQMKINSAGFRITAVRINESLDPVQEVSGSNGIVKFEIEGETDYPQDLAIESRLYDSSFVPIGLFSPAFDSGEATKVSRGHFQLSASVRLPRLAAGDYYMSIAVNTPEVWCHAEAQHAVKLRTFGAQGAAGRTFNDNGHFGNILLDEAK